MKKGILIFLMGMILLVGSGWTAAEVKQEDLTLLQTLMDIMGSKFGDFTTQLNTFQGKIGSIVGKVGAMETKSDALSKVDQFLWTKIENVDQSIRETIVADEEQQNKLLQDKVWAINQRLKWIDSGITSLKDEVKGIYEEIYAIGEGSTVEDQNLLTAIEGLEKGVTDKYEALNQQFKWVEKTLKSVKGEDEAVNSALGKLTAELLAMQEGIGTLQSENQASQLKIQQNDVMLRNYLTENVEKSAQEKYDALTQQLKWVDKALKGLKSEDETANNALDNMVEGVNSLQTSILALQGNDRFLWNKIDISDKKLQESILKGDQASNQLITDKIVSLNQRLKWVDSGIEKVKNDLQAIATDVESINAGLLKIEEIRKASEDSLSQKVEDRVWAINKRLGWTDNAVSILKTAVAEQAQKLTTATTQLKEEIGNKLWGVGERLTGLDERFSQLIDLQKESGEITQLSLTNAELEIQILRAKVQTLQLEKTLQNTLNDLMIGKLNEVQDRCAALEKQLKQAEAEFATKKELAATVQKVDEKFSSNDLRLKWVDQTLASQKNQISTLQQNLTDLDTKLSGELSTRVWAINQRLKWIDGAITILKEGKAEKSVFEQAVTEIQDQLSQVGNDIFELAVSIQENTNQIQTTNQVLKETESKLQGLITTTKTDVQTEMSSIKARLEASISSNTRLLESHSRTLDDLETRVQTLEDKVFPAPKNTEPLGIFAIMIAVVGLGFLLANQ